MDEFKEENKANKKAPTYNSLEEAIKKIDLLEEENRKLRECFLNEYSTKYFNDISFKDADFSYSWSWIKRICYVIYKAEKPLQIDDIGNALILIDEQFKAVRYKTKMLSFHLWRAASLGRLKRFKIVGNGGYYYSL